MKTIHFFLLAVLALSVAVVSCSKDELLDETATTAYPTPSYSIQAVGIAENEEIYEPVYIQDPTDANVQLKCMLFVPASEAAVPAVVVQHGCGGLWKNDNPASDSMELQFRIWVDSFRVHNMAALFIDSYSARSEDEYCNMAPPNNIAISSEFVRSRDAYVGLKLLRENGRIDGSKVALLGFSHGGSSVLSTMVDAEAVARSTPWFYRTYNPTTTYTNGVLAPAEPPAGGGFVAAVSYYPGASFYEYFGKPGTPSDGKYVPYAPVMIHAAATDALYTAQYTNYDDPAKAKQSSYTALLQKAVLNGSSVANGNQMVMHVHPGAAHSFDGKTSGADGTANLLAKDLTLDWLESYLRP